MIKIDKNIPIPPGKFGSKRRIYPWKEMEVGDSFFVPNTEGRRNKAHGGYATANKHYAPKRFSQRVVEGGIRVWRVT